jgi:hypothetical protein
MMVARLLDLRRIRAAVLACAVAVAMLFGAVGAQDEIIYEGTARLTVELVDVYGRHTGTPTYETHVKIVLAEAHPLESNPFHMSLQTEPLVNAPGEISLWSGLAAEGTFFQYWTYDFVDEGSSRFAGTLTDPHTRESIALNLMTIPVDIAPNLNMPYILAIGQGAEMVGEFAGDELAIAVEGNTTDAVHPFELQIEATRTR